MAADSTPVSPDSDMIVTIRPTTEIAAALGLEPSEPEQAPQRPDISLALTPGQSLFIAWLVCQVH